MSMYDKSKFRFSETFNNKDGKTSGSGFIGVIIGLVSALVVILGIFAYFFKYDNSLEFMEIGLKGGGVAAALMAARKVGGGFVESRNRTYYGDPEELDPDDPPPFDERG